MSDDFYTGRAFKTAWFEKAARKAQIEDAELSSAHLKVRRGLANDLGGGVFKVRLRKNLYRAIVISEGERYCVFVYLQYRCR